MSERKALLSILFLVFLTILLRTAWLGDDAYITMRSVDNWVHGYGLTWNPGERVQTFSHPLWMLLLAGVYAVLGQAYFSLIGLSLLVSLGVMAVFIARASRDLSALAFGWLLLVLSHAFLDYSTSGLENPLSHLLALVFVLVFLERIPVPANRRVFILSLLAGLAVLNRMDTLLLYLPALAGLLWQSKTRRRLMELVAGFIPFLLWSLFALFYYGFIFPNTYYAKLNTAIPHTTLLHQGVIYYLNEVLFDPLTLAVIVCGLLASLAGAERRQRAIAFGMVLYLGYIFYIGGDLMSGRFFSIIFLMSVSLLLPHFEKFNWQTKALAGLAVLFLGLMAPSAAFLPPASIDIETAHRTGVSDERAFYYSASGLTRWGRSHKLPEHEWVSEGIALREQQTPVYVGKGIGYLGFYAGPQVHVIDYFALSDPLLARLPVQPGLKWDIGHIRREIPAGYLESLASAENQIADPNLAAYYEKLSILTRANLWSWERISTIVEFNLGRYLPLLDAYLQTKAH
ncbi:MAG: hypothetical protein RBS68_04755 [Anaerolineales bacterium]|jgi:arabinofuranosyltransferase|nr:hypothetical protein [Anaerolineales bacterium]